MSTDERILDAALRIVEHEGLRSATTRRIAEEAGVNEVTLFRRFGSKDQLLLEAMRRRGGTRSELPGIPVEPMQELTAWVVQRAHDLHASRGLIRSTMVEIHRHPELCQAAHERPRQLRAELVAFFEALRERGLASGDWDASAVARMLMGALYSDLIADPIYDEHDPISAEAIANRYVPLVLRAIGVQTRGSR